MEPQPPDLVSQFPQLQQNDGNVTLHVAIDKSVSKVAAWVIGYVVASSILVGVAIAAFIWMIFEWRDAQVETRVQTQEIMYTQAAVAAHGIPIPHPGKSDSKHVEEK